MHIHHIYQHLLLSYAHGLFPISLYLLMTAHTVGLHIHPDWSPLTIYLLLSWLCLYPAVDHLESNLFQRHTANSQNTAVIRHRADLLAHDRGSNWRVAHTRISPLILKDSLPSITLGSWLLRQITRFGLMALAPIIVLLLWVQRSLRPVSSCRRPARPSASHKFAHKK